MAELPVSTAPLSRRRFLAGTAALGAAVVLHPWSARAQADRAHLRLMETTDLHVHVVPYDYYADKPLDSAGLARTAAIVDEIRREARNALLFDNGDFLQGNPMGDYIAYERGMGPSDTHPVIQAMNVLGYDAGTLGNHEFNYGLAFMERTLAGARHPVVCANLAKGALAATPEADARFVPPYVVLDRHVTLGDGSTRPIRIGVIGFVPPQITVWDAAHLDGRAATREIVETARALVPKLKAEGADIVLALSHSGIAAEGEGASENASLQLASVEGIDVVFTGHQHLQFPGKDFEGIEGADAAKGTLAGKPAVMPGFWGSHLGVVDLDLEHDGARWRIVESAVELRPISERTDDGVKPLVESDARVLDSVRAEHEATLAYVRRPVGETAAPLFSYFALVADDPSVQIVNQAQSWYLKDILATTEHAGLPLLSAAAPFKSGGRSGPDYYTDIPAGPIAIRNVADLYLYPNTLRAVRITGAEVKEWLEMSAGIFNRIEPGRPDQPLIATDFPSYNFDVIDGVTYEIDVTQPAKYTAKGEIADASASRIRNLAFDGRPIDPAASFIVATNNYRAGGGGNFPGLSEEKIVFVAPDANRDVLVRYIVSEGTINPSADANWRFAPAGGVPVTFRTGPGAARHLAAVPDAKPGDTDAEGYLVFRLTI